jgi:hypothetical protein
MELLFPPGALAAIRAVVVFRRGRGIGGRSSTSFEPYPPLFAVHGQPFSADIGHF